MNLVIEFLNSFTPRAMTLDSKIELLGTLHYTEIMLAGRD